MDGKAGSLNFSPSGNGIFQWAKVWEQKAARHSGFVLSASGTSE